MARFAYKAVRNDGTEVFGIIEAEDESGALKEINRQGLLPTDVRPARVADELRARMQEEKRQREIQQRRRHKAVRERHARQRLVVRYKDGRVQPGICYALNPLGPDFHLDLVDENGVSVDKTVRVMFNDLKAVFSVKSFDGKFDKSAHYREREPEGDEVVVKFDDGEILRGCSLRRYDPAEPRFFLIPNDPTGNNISVLVERSAVDTIYTAEDYEALLAEKKRKLQETQQSGGLCQAETMGDFYFETRNYDAALEQYAIASENNPHSARVRKKMLASQFNIGVQHIKRREYAQALKFMQRVLEADPGNKHARKKIHQLRRILEKEQSTKSAEQVQDAP
ncbi:MAG TPA: hypothetical protein HPP77_11400 [Candidatus Hydrogenedentes bacterium]|nr:hypothetical protein [Candidatus Hydrogenedentota bacterium]HIJ73260.1 hypothetical protein [Candidatus Hydrogenedentota bacterium]